MVFPFYFIEEIKKDPASNRYFIFSYQHVKEDKDFFSLKPVVVQPITCHFFFVLLIFVVAMQMTVELCHDQ